MRRSYARATREVRWEGAEEVGRRTYTLTVMRRASEVINHFFVFDQFCGFSGSSGPSHVTLFGSTFSSTIEGTYAGTFGVGSSGTSPPYCSARRSSRCASCTHAGRTRAGGSLNSVLVEEWGDAGVKTPDMMV